MNQLKKKVEYYEGTGTLVQIEVEGQQVEFILIGPDEQSLRDLLTEKLNWAPWSLDSEKMMNVRITPQ